MFQKYSYGLMDKDELRQSFTKEGVCPFYFSKDKMDSADVILIPYVYLLNWEINDFCLKYIRNSIIVFDEGHNLLSAVTDGSKIQLTLDDFEKILNEIKNLNKIKTDVSIEIKNVYSFVSSLHAFMSSIEYSRLIGTQNDLRFRDLLKIFEKSLEFSPMSSPAYLKKFFCVDENKSFCIKKLYSICKPVDSFLESKEYLEIQQARSSEKFNFLSSFNIKKFFKKIKLLNNIFSKIKNFKQMEEFCLLIDMNTEKKGITVFCLSPKIGLDMINEKEPHSIIVTSGTLSPFKNFELEANLKFPVKFSGNHIISMKEQVFLFSNNRFLKQKIIKKVRLLHH